MRKLMIWLGLLLILVNFTSADLYNLTIDFGSSDYYNRTATTATVNFNNESNLTLDMPYSIDFENQSIPPEWTFKTNNSNYTFVKIAGKIYLNLSVEGGTTLVNVGGDYSLNNTVILGRTFPITNRNYTAEFVGNFTVNSPYQGAGLVLLNRSDAILNNSYICVLPISVCQGYPFILFTKRYNIEQRWQMLYFDKDGVLNTNNFGTYSISRTWSMTYNQPTDTFSFFNESISLTSLTPGTPYPFNGTQQGIGLYAASQGGGAFNPLFDYLKINIFNTSAQYFSKNFSIPEAIGMNMSITNNSPVGTSINVFFLNGSGVWNVIGPDGGIIFPVTNTFQFRIDMNTTDISYSPSISRLNFEFFLPEPSIIIEYNNATETELVNISLIINSTNMTANLIYNGSYYYDAVKTVIGVQTRFHKIVRAPFISNFTENKSIVWEYKINYSSISGSPTNTTSFNQTVRQMRISNCSSSDAFYSYGYSQSTNITIKNEVTDLTLNASNITGFIDATFEFWLVNQTYSKNLSLRLRDKGDYRICHYPSDKNLTTDTTFEYGAPSFDTRTYYFDNVLLRGNNNTDFYDFYLLPSTNSTNIFIYVRDENGKAMQNAYVYINRKFSGTGKSETVEVLKTDYNGEDMAHLILYNALYSFQIKKEAALLYSTTEAKIMTTTYYFTVNTITGLLQLYDKVLGISYNAVSYNNATQKMSFTYNDVNSIADTIYLEVIRRTATGDIILCETSSTATSDTLLCNNLNIDTNGHYMAKVYVKTKTGSPNDFYPLSFWEHLTSSRFIFGQMGVFLSFGFITLVGIMGLVVSPALGIILTLGGLIIMYASGLLQASWSIIVLVIVAGVFIIIKMRA